MRSFLVLGLPAPQGSKTHVGDGRMVESSKRVKPWRRQVAAAYADRNFGDMLDGPVSIIVDFYLPRPKAHYGTGRNAGTLKGSAPVEHLTMPDLDKLVRAVGDALTRLAWRDDSQIVAWHAYKHYATTMTPVGAQITILEVGRC